MERQFGAVKMSCCEFKISARGWGFDPSPFPQHGIEALFFLATLFFTLYFTFNFTQFGVVHQKSELAMTVAGHRVI